MSGPYWYNWNTTQPQTNDPNYRDKPLPYGFDNKITLDGRDVSSLLVTRIQTGENGWIEAAERDARGKPAIDHGKGELKTFTLYGKVTYEDLTNQETPNPHLQLTTNHH